MPAVAAPRISMLAGKPVAIDALSHRKATVSTSTGSFGLRIGYQDAVSMGMLVPQLRLEYQHDFQGATSATLGYADLLSGPLPRANVVGLNQNRMLLGLGASMQTWKGWPGTDRGVPGHGSERRHSSPSVGVDLDHFRVPFQRLIQHGRLAQVDLLHRIHATDLVAQPAADQIEHVDREHRWRVVVRACR
ncbi:MAG: autotransporter domain-containing protein [Rhodanobacter sp.]|nr:MAG: autotransporter domain-containing protein [Rhodanobacter sp.]